MTPLEIGLLALAGMGLMMLLGFHAPVALMAASFGGVWAIKGSPELAAKLLALAANDALQSYFFGVVPLFVLMGFAVSEAGFGRDAFEVANAAFRRLAGGLGMAAVGGSAIFAAITGVSIASAAVFARIAAPEMIRAGYAPRFAVGIVAGSSVLGMLIPPSLLLILYGLLTEQSVGDLFLAGIGPGLLLAGLFGVLVMALVAFAPGFAGRPTRPAVGAAGAGALLGRAAPIAALILLVLGGIYGGLFTPVEAGAMGALGALALGFAMGRLDLAALRRILVETGLVTAAVCLLIVAAQMYSRMLAFSGVPAGLAGWAISAELGLWGLLFAYVGVLILLGTILDSGSIMLISVPLFLPAIQPFGADLVWLGIVTVIAVEIGLLTPPFGMSVYVVKATMDDPSIRLADVFIGAAPFALAMLVCLGLVMLFPWIATGLLPGR